MTKRINDAPQSYVLCRRVILRYPPPNESKGLSLAIPIKLVWLHYCRAAPCSTSKVFWRIRKRKWNNCSIILTLVVCRANIPELWLSVVALQHFFFSACACREGWSVCFCGNTLHCSETLLASISFRKIHGLFLILLDLKINYPIITKAILGFNTILKRFIYPNHKVTWCKATAFCNHVLNPQK